MSRVGGLRPVDPCPSRAWLCSSQMLGSLSDGDNPSMNQLVCFVPGMLALGALHADGKGGGGRMAASSALTCNT